MGDAQSSVVIVFALTETARVAINFASFWADGLEDGVLAVATLIVT